MRNKLFLFLLLLAPSLLRAQAFPPPSGGGGGGMEIGGDITDATEGSCLFAGPGGVLAQDPANCFWDDATNVHQLKIGSGAAGSDASLFATSVGDSGTSTIKAVSQNVTPGFWRYALESLSQITGSGGSDNAAGNYFTALPFGTFGDYNHFEFQFSDSNATAITTGRNIYFQPPSLANTTNFTQIEFGNVSGCSGTCTVLKTGTGKVQFGGLTEAPLYASTTNCADSAGAAACGAAPAGSFVIDAGSNTTVVSTTAVTDNSQIFLQIDASLGTRLSVTCNTDSGLALGAPRVIARTAATSFTADIDIIGGPVANPLCMNYWIVN